MNIGTRLKIRRKALDMTLEEVAAVVGISRQTLSRYETGVINNIPSDKIELLAKALQTTPAYIMGWEDTRSLPSNVLPMPQTSKKPRLGRVACGVPILAEQNIECYDDVPDYVKCDFTLVCQGDSMINARIFDGDIVCIKLQEQVESGEIAAVMVDDDEATLKRVKLFDDHVVLEPENPLYRPMVFWGEEANRLRIIGKATHFISKIH